MRILLIEDEDRSARQTKSQIEHVSNRCDVTVVGSRDDAFDVMDRESFDLIICDLRIPPNKDSADIDEIHGLAVHGRAREIAPGTPLVFLTAFATPRNTKDQLSGGGVANVYGITDYRLVQLVEKDDVEGLEDYFRTLIGAYNSLELSCAVTGSEVEDPMFERAVRVYAKSTGHDTAMIESTSGLSGATVGRVRLQSTNQPPAKVFIKMLSHQAATDEYERYDHYVANRLQPGDFAPALTPIRAGFRKSSAVIFTLADERYVSFFELLRQAPDQSIVVVRKLRQALEPWLENSINVPVKLSELRKSRISDDQLSAAGLLSPGFSKREDKSVIMRTAISHGDLHGENVLVDSDRRPMLIDFGDVGSQYAVIDPITLELSVIYHAGGPARLPEFGADIKWDSWPDVGACYGNTPLAGFARECRQWAYGTDSPQAVAAFAYAHSLRQLKYSDVSKEVASAVAEACVSSL